MIHKINTAIAPLLAVDGWEQEIVFQSAPSNMYLVIGTVMALTCAVFIALVIMYGLKR